jgi:cell division protease FtsH
LHRLSVAQATNRSSREIALEDLHGMPEARAWADAALSDLAAWKRGEIAWEAAVSCAVLVGPPGTGKTLFCESFARNVGPFIACSYARWQSDGEGHLGHTLRAMARDFQAAREQAPSVMLIDEIDSFPDRASVTHSHRDYTRSVGNALLEEIEGARRREGVFVLGCSNAIDTCDPALLRAGRLETIIRIGPPGPADLERIMRVKLGRDLFDEPLDGFAELAVGMTGADVEKIVDDARRAARREKRPLGAEDLRKAIVGDDVPEQMRWRTAVHEAGHIVAEVVLFGPADVIATTAANRQRLGVSVRTQVGTLEGTPREYRARIVILLAGRTAEETVLREPSHGSSSDIEVATTLACAMHGSLGLAGPNRSPGPEPSRPRFPAIS